MESSVPEITRITAGLTPGMFDNMPKESVNLIVGPRTSGRSFALAMAALQFAKGHPRRGDDKGTIALFGGFDVTITVGKGDDALTAPVSEFLKTKGYTLVIVPCDEENRSGTVYEACDWHLVPAYDWVGVDDYDQHFRGYRNEVVIRRLSLYAQHYGCPVFLTSLATGVYDHPGIRHVYLLDRERAYPWNDRMLNHPFVM